MTTVHTWSEWQTDSECGSTVEYRYCTDGVTEISGFSEADGFIAAAREERTVEATTQHQWSNWTVSWSVPCFATLEKRECSICGASETQVLPATQDHVWGKWSKSVSGYSFHVCKVCGHEESDREDKGLVHSGALTLYTGTCITRRVSCSFNGVDYYFASCSLCETLGFMTDVNGVEIACDDCYVPLLLDFPFDHSYNNDVHEGGTELRNVVAVTDTTNGYTGDLYCLGCDGLIEAGSVVYAVLTGADSTWTADTTSGLAIRSSAEFAKFVEVRVNGSVLDPKYYTVTEGSTIVTLPKDYLDTLANGEYTIEIVSEDGSATTTFTVSGSAAVDGSVPVNGTEDTKKDEAQTTDTTKKDTTSGDSKKDTTSTSSETKKDTAAANPKTGDESNLVLWVSVLTLSLVLAVAVMLTSKKRYTGRRVK